jgi:hypothetical protein
VDSTMHSTPGSRLFDQSTAIADTHKTAASRKLL